MRLAVSPISPFALPQSAVARSPVILAVPDSDLDSYTLRSFDCVAARTAAEFAALLAAKRPPVGIVDADVAHLDGRALCVAARNHHATSSILVTITSPEQAPMFLKAGCHSLLLKPFAPTLLSTKVGRLVRQRALAPRAEALEGRGVAAQFGTNRSWPDVSCPRCSAPDAVGFEFSSHRRMWFACSTCDHVWIGPRQE